VSYINAYNSGGYIGDAVSEQNNSPANSECNGLSVVSLLVVKPGDFPAGEHLRA
jgi:hypothetical protein